MFVIMLMCLQLIDEAEFHHSDFMGACALSLH
jgi:hypothetical protein